MMGEFEVDCRKVTGCVEKIFRCNSDLKRQKERVADILNQIGLHENYIGVKQAITRITDNLNRQQNQMKQYGNVLADIVNAYEGTQMRIMEHAVSLTGTQQAANGNSHFIGHISPSISAMANMLASAYSLP